MLDETWLCVGDVDGDAVGDVKGESVGLVVEDIVLGLSVGVHIEVVVGMSTATVMVRPCIDDMIGLTAGDAVGDVDAGTVHESHGAGHNKAAAGQPVAATIARQVARSCPPKGYKFVGESVGDAVGDVSQSGESSVGPLARGLGRLWADMLDSQSA